MRSDPNILRQLREIQGEIIRRGQVRNVEMGYATGSDIPDDTAARLYQETLLAMNTALAALSRQYSGGRG